MKTLFELFPKATPSADELNFLDMEEPPHAQEAHDVLLANGWALDQHEYTADCDSDGQFMEIGIESSYVHATEGKVTMHHTMTLIMESAFRSSACDSVVESIFWTPRDERRPD